MSVHGERPATVATGPRRALSGVAVFVPAAAALVTRFVTGPHPVDDAFITFRYARNLALGLGLVYNPGEWVLGTTAPLWAGLLATFYRLGATDLPVVAWIVASLADAVSATLVAVLAVRLGFRPWAAALVGLAWALNPLSVAYAAGGMETSLFVLAALSAMTLVAGERATWGAFLAGSSVVVRPEGTILAGACVVAACLMRGRVLPRPIVAAAIPVIGWTILLLAMYGTPIPQTALAKQVAYISESPWASFLVLVFHTGQPGWSNFFPGQLPVIVAFNIMLLGLSLMGFLGWRAWRTRPGKRLRAAWLPFALFGALYLLFHGLGGFRGARLFPWYLVPLNALYLLLAAAGLRGISGFAPWLAVGLVLWQIPAIDWQRPFLPLGFDLRREELYQRVAADLRAELPSGSLVAAPEIGVIGYVTDLPILDTVGLVSPLASSYYPLPRDQVEGDNAIPPRLILDVAPDAVVTLDGFARRSLLPDPTFQSRYRLTRAYPAPIWGSTELLVYRRVSNR